MAGTNYDLRLVIRAKDGISEGNIRDWPGEFAVQHQVFIDLKRLDGRKRE